MSEDTMCACGKPLHYCDPEIRSMVEKVIASAGENMKVHLDGRTWMVPRHYIALHGLKAKELPSLGFPEIICNDPKNSC